MRLLFVTTSLIYGGAERHAVTLMNRMTERGHETHAVHVKDVKPDQADRIRLGVAGTLRCLNAARYFDRRAVADFADHLTRIRPSVIVAANPYALMYAWLALRLARTGTRTALVVTYHSTRLLNVKERLQMMLYRLFFWTADFSVFVCEKQRRYWRRRGVFSRRSEVIYNGVDTDEYCDTTGPEKRAALRSALGFAETDYVIGISAWLRPEKNHLQLVDAVAALRKKGIPARALMIGEGEMRQAIEARARALEVENHVVITGHQEDVRPCIAASDAMVLCSFTEAFSLAAIEAMALCKPVVHSDVGGAAEMIRCAREGFLFPVGDTGALVDRLAALADRGLAARLGAQARVAVETRFSERTMVDRYESLLLELSGRTSPSPAAV